MSDAIVYGAMRTPQFLQFFGTAHGYAVGQTEPSVYGFLKLGCSCGKGVPSAQDYQDAYNKADAHLATHAPPAAE